MTAWLLRMMYIFWRNLLKTFLKDRITLSSGSTWSFFFMAAVVPCSSSLAAYLWRYVHTMQCQLGTGCWPQSTGAHLRDEDFLLHHKVKDHFPENKKKPTYQIFLNLNVFKCYVSGFALICGSGVKQLTNIFIYLSEFSESVWLAVMLLKSSDADFV